MYTGELIVMTFSAVVVSFHHVSSRPSPDSAIRFPQEPSSRGFSLTRRPTDSPKLVYPNVPVCADAKGTFCENVTNYPSQEELKRSIQYSRDEFLEIFGPVNLHPKSRVKEDDLGEERICSQQPKIFYPKAAKNDDDEWMFVINDVSYVQMVYSEICESDGDSCLYLDNNLPAGFGSKCKQLFAHKRLLALGPSDKRSHIASFRFPSCCVCYVRFPVGWTHSRAKTLT